MEGAPSTYRTDAQLRAMMDMTGDWVVNNACGLIMSNIVPSLRDALKIASSYSGVQAIPRLPPEGVIIFGGQMERMTVFLAATPIKGLSGAWDFKSG